MYKDIASNLETFKITYPKTFVPSPSVEDYDNGFIIRYFLRKTNDTNGHIFEVDKQTYNDYIINPFWIAEFLYWRIKGPLNIVYDLKGNKTDIGVINSNNNSINFASKKLPNVNLYLPNILQFYKG